MANPAGAPFLPEIDTSDRLTRILCWGRPARRIEGIEDAGHLTRVIGVAILMWTAGIAAFASVMIPAGSATTGSLVLYLSLGPVLALSYLAARRTGLLPGVLPVLVVLWVSLLGVINEFYLAAAPVVAVLMCATFVSWMGGRVAPLYVAAAVVGGIAAGIVSRDPYLIDRVLLVAFSTVFTGVIAGRQSDRARQASEDREVLLARLAHESRHDPLTGLGNRMLLVEELSGALNRTSCQRVALALIDLDRFKDINDRHGHLTGDTVLIEVGHRLRQVAGENGVAVRVGGDEFAVLRLDPHASAAEIAAEIEQALTWSAQHDGDEYRVGASVGVSVRVARDAALEELFATADRVMYERKSVRRAHT